MKYLIDTSALVRVIRRQVESRWDDLTGHGQIAVCDPVLIETLTIAHAKEVQRQRERLLNLYPWVSVPDGVWDSVWRVHAALTEYGAHQGLSIADQLVVATALHHRLTVLHLDGDFETAARIIPELQQERIT